MSAVEKIKGQTSNYGNHQCRGACGCERCNNDKGSRSLRHFAGILRSAGDPRADRVKVFREWHKQRLIDAAAAD